MGGVVGPGRHRRLSRRPTVSLDRSQESSEPPKAATGPLTPVEGPRRAGGRKATPYESQSAFEQGLSHLELPRLQLLDPRQCGLTDLDEALTVLDTVTFKLKRDLLEAGVACVSADKRVTVTEGELLRGTADALGCPMPPLLPGQPIA
jgi:hypothetical protein